MTEIWNPVVGYEGAYEVSDQGQVRSVPRVFQRSSSPMTVTGRVMRLKPNARGYPSVRLRMPGHGKTWEVHVLVASAFLGSRPDGYQVRHLDGNPLNNRLTNLAYGTVSENRLDSVRHGTHNHAGRANCYYGHPLDGRSRGKRFCKVCRRRHQQEYQKRKRQNV